MKRLGILIAAAVFTLASQTAHAGDLMWGPQAGFSISPDQIVFGFHAITPVGDRFDLVPSADIGLGDSFFTVSLNGDLRMNIAPESKLKPYVGGGVALFFADPDEGDSGSEFGGNVLGGVWLNKGGQTAYYIEGKIGLGDVPDFKAMLGINF